MPRVAVVVRTVSFCAMLLPLGWLAPVPVQATTRVVARTGDAAPDGNGSFSNFGSHGRDELSAGDVAVLNSAGQVAFWGILTGTSGGDSDNSGIFFFDDRLGLRQVAREGDPFLGSTLASLQFRENFGGAADAAESSGLNALGRVAYLFELADGPAGHRRLVHPGANLVRPARPGRVAVARPSLHRS